MDDRRRALATIGILIGLFLGAIDATIVGTSMPTIVAQLGGISIYFLVFSGFLVAQVVAVPVFGRLADLFGRRRLHLAGVVLFTGASALCGLARSMPALIAFRSLQGAGAGCLMALSFTMVGDLYPLEARARVQGLISGIWGIASLLGPLAGGFITQHWGWPWVFYVNVPFGVLSAAIVQSAWREDVRRDARVDVPGAVLLALSATVLLAAFAFAPKTGWLSAPVLGLLGAAVVLLAALAAVERRSPSPFLQYDLYRIRLFATGALTGCCAATVLFATTSYLPLYAQGVIGSTPTAAGLILVPMMLPWVACSAASGYLLLRFGYRSMAIAGMILATAGFAVLSTYGTEPTWTATALPLCLIGAGLGLTIAPLLIAAQNAVPKDRLGAATSLTQFTRTFGGALGIAIMGALLSAALVRHAPTDPGAPSPDEVVDPIRRRALPREKIDLWRVPLARGLRGVFLAGAVAAAAGCLAALAIPRGRAQDFVHGG